MKVDFITFCHKGDFHRLYQPGWLHKMVASHEYHFDTVRIVHQRCGDFTVPEVGMLNGDSVNFIRSEDFPNIFQEFGINENNPIADEWTHGPTAPHYHLYHCMNHLIGLTVSDADYIVFSDSDCTIQAAEPSQNWIRKGIELLQLYPEILIVSPGDGGIMAEAMTPQGYRLTQNVSQQLFLCSRKRLKSVNFELPFNEQGLKPSQMPSQMKAPGEPFQEFYYLLEGRIWRYMALHGYWRCVLPDYVARYYHWNRLTDDGYFETDISKY